MEPLTEVRVLLPAQMSAPCLRIDVEISAGVPSIPPQPGPVRARVAPGCWSRSDGGHRFIDPRGASGWAD